MTSYDRRWIRCGPLALSARSRRGTRARVAGRRGNQSGRSKLWRDEGKRVRAALKQAGYEVGEL